MLHHAASACYSPMIFSDQGHRCQICGGGPVSMEGGHLSMHCRNCGRYSSGGIDLVSAVKSTIKKFKNKVFGS